MSLGEMVYLFNLVYLKAPFVIMGRSKSSSWDERSFVGPPRKKKRWQSVPFFLLFFFVQNFDCMVKLPKEAERKAKEEGRQTKQVDEVIYGDYLTKQDWR